ncbi:ATP-dependent 6-phosphofructokinase [Pelomonas sp. SE-A7]|uniref:6-phosphofructokinase n=1 Tax=Pelomonas sp. SE-A7 TaxID=3054953 RepID=UPI00259CD463|nr:ATP-dependent 6-phosphofructokinase [Pelomonas sp. SE-A7]MDM4765598.1 ATP-dependent 6-phosphofructokinase [Pelomonas sp. SE-A7]
MRVGILTGGGDCPGLNAVIRAVSLALIEQHGAEILGIERGFLGLIEGRVRKLDAAGVRGIVNEGGTLLGTHNRADPFHYFGAGGSDVSARAIETLDRAGVDALIAIGGDGTMTIAERFARLGVPVVGVPKTIDNDVAHNERSFGFDSAVAVVAEALGRLETTARSHGRLMVVETMGRHAGWIALEGGLAGGADAMLLPERPFDPDVLAAHCFDRCSRQGFALVCVAEGAHELGGELVLQSGPGSVERLGGVGQRVTEGLQRRLGGDLEVRHTLLGHLQRGGNPTAFDRVLATRFGVQAARMVVAGEFGHMVALQEGQCRAVPLIDVAGRMRQIPESHELLIAAHDLGVCLG